MFGPQSPVDPRQDETERLAFVSRRVLLPSHHRLGELCQSQSIRDPFPAQHAIVSSGFSSLRRGFVARR